MFCGLALYCCDLLLHCLLLMGCGCGLFWLVWWVSDLVFGIVVMVGVFCVWGFLLFCGCVGCVLCGFWGLVC